MQGGSAGGLVGTRNGSGTAMTYDQFWLRYLRAHSRSHTRALHYIGSVLALGTLLVAIEGNRPETFEHPFWSLFSDYRMLTLALGFRLAPQLQRAGLR